MPDDQVPLRVLTPAEGRELFANACRRYLQMEPEAFVAAWEAGVLAWDCPTPAVSRVAILLPFWTP